MTLAVAIVLALLGIGVIVFGLGYYIFFRIGLTLFERSLKSEIAEAGRGHVDRAVMASAVVAQLVAVAEMNWSRPYGKPDSKKR